MGRTAGGSGGSMGDCFLCKLFWGKLCGSPDQPFPALYGIWVVCLLAILGGMAKYGDFENGVTRWMGKRSFGLYIFHYLGISFTALMLGKSGNVPPLMVYSLSLAAGFAAGYILNGVISKIPFFRWAVLGIGKEKNSVQG